MAGEHRPLAEMAAARRVGTAEAGRALVQALARAGGSQGSTLCAGDSTWERVKRVLQTPSTHANL